jgi:hypothetical protein
VKAEDFDTVFYPGKVRKQSSDTRPRVEPRLGGILGGSRECTGRVILPLERFDRANDWCWRLYARRDRLGNRSRNLAESGGGTVIVVQHAAQALAPLDHAGFPKLARFGTDQSVGQALVIAFVMVMCEEFVSGFTQRALAKQDHAL